MMVDRAMTDVQEAEVVLREDLRSLADTHAADADVFHVALMLAKRCSTQLGRLDPHLDRYDAGGAKASAGSDSNAKRVGLVLLEDLAERYLAAHRAELAWAVLVQAARAARDPELLAAATEGREEAERRWKWLRTKIKTSSPQVLLAS